MKKLNTFCKLTTTLDFQTVILVLYEKSVYWYIPCSFYIVLLALYWPVDLSLAVKTSVEESFRQSNYLEGFMLMKLFQPIGLDLRRHSRCAKQVVSWFPQSHQLMCLYRPLLNEQPVGCSGTVQRE